MIRIITLCAALIVSSTAFAKNVPTRKSEPFPKLLTSRELLALTPARRLAYFIKLRKLLVELSAMNRKGHGTLVSESAEAQVELYSQMLEYLNSVSRSILPKADAATCSAQYPFDLGPLCGSPCAGRDSLPEETTQTVNNYLFCFPRDQFYSWYDQPNRTDMKLSEQSRLRLLTDSKPKNQSFPHPPMSFEGEAPVVAETTAIAEAQPPPPAETVPATRGWLATCKSNLPPQGDLQFSECSHSWVNKAIFDGQEAALRNEAAAGAAKEATADTAEKIAETPPPAAATCPAPQFACGEKERDNYRSKQRAGALDKFRKGAPKSCIYGGNMSAYRNNEVKPGNCADVSEFCTQKDKCAGKAEDTESGFKTKYSCEKGKTLCQPFIFGLTNRATAICVPKKGSDITEKCDAAAKKVRGSAAYVVDLLDSKLNGAAEAWDEYADNFNKICEDGSDSQAAHCEECAVIGKRLAEANLMATGKCNKAFKSSEIKSKGSTEAPATER